MAARACANMGCPRLCLVAPERWELEKARPLAPPKGLPVLESLRVAPSLAEAVGASGLVVGTTARLGGWRKSVLTADQAGDVVAGAVRGGVRVSLVFGSEDRGLSNEELLFCQRLATIPTAGEASSLNLAQAVLILLYECARALRSGGASAPDSECAGDTTRDSRGAHGISAAEQERLMEAFKAMLLTLDVLHGDNPDYFLLPWRRLFGRAQLSRHEYDALMGLCRQVRNKLGPKGPGAA
ncbi:MAG: RNA methyltransferase, partial [Desulfovibrio sp.]|nr:RNA methyltransferase [Desulfovibrio sp.]